MKYLLIGLKRTLDFKGRSSREEYWWFQISIIIVYFALTMLTFPLVKEKIFFILPLFSIIVLFTSISAIVRRLHDTGNSGWWALLILLALPIPVLFFVPPMILFTCKKGDVGDNKYGSPSPY